MYKYYMIIMVLVFSFTGCVSSKSPARVKFENDKLLHDLSVLKECRIKSVKKLDDKISSAEIIAVVVIEDCSKESKYVMDANMLDKSDEERKKFNEQMNGVQTSGVIGLILKNRQKIEDKPLKQTKFKKYEKLLTN